MLFVARSHYHHEGIAVNRLSQLCLALNCLFFLVPLWGALPLLIYVEGAGYMTSPSRIRITLLQVSYNVQAGCL